MSQITYPNSYAPAVQRLQPATAQKVFASPFNGAQQVVNLPGGEAWQLEMSHVNLEDEARGELTAFYTKTRVSRNTFLITNHTAPQLGQFGGAPTVATGSQMGSVLVVSSAGDLVSSWACVGDFISINNELKMVLADAGTTSAQVVSLELWPPLRLSPDSGSTVVVTSPVGTFRLANATAFNMKPPRYMTDISAIAIEAVSSERVVDL